jgi:hypothetical protein
VNRREQGASRALAQSVAQAKVAAASDAAVVAAQIDEAVTGDLTTSSPILAEKLADLDRRITALQPEE